MVGLPGSVPETSDPAVDGEDAMGPVPVPVEVDDQATEVEGGQDAAPVEAVDLTVFYAALAPYGRWVLGGGYGWIWIPYPVPAGWRPYTRGHWVLTDHGWTWFSSERFGWATDHYGGWVLDPRYGWIWVPGYEWCAARVAWREGDGFIGWAPLPPAGVGAVVAMNATPPPPAFVFVKERSFLDARLASEIVPASLNGGILARTTVPGRSVLNGRVVNGGSVLNGGVAPSRLEQVLGRKIDVLTAAVGPSARVGAPVPAVPRAISQLQATGYGIAPLPAGGTIVVPGGRLIHPPSGLQEPARLQAPALPVAGPSGTASLLPPHSAASSPAGAAGAPAGPRAEQRSGEAQARQQQELDQRERQRQEAQAQGQERQRQAEMQAQQQREAEQREQQRQAEAQAQQQREQQRQAAAQAQQQREQQRQAEVQAQQQQQQRQAEQAAQREREQQEARRQAEQQTQKPPHQ